MSGTTHLHAQGGHPHRDCGTVPVTEQGYQSLRGGSMTPGDEGRAQAHGPFLVEAEAEGWGRLHRKAGLQGYCQALRTLCGSLK